MHTIATIAYDAVNPFELAVATEVFGFERPELGVPWYRFLVCAVEPRPIRTSVDMLLSTPNSLQHVAEADTVIVPSSRPGVVPVPDTLLEALRQAYQRGARMISFCTGTFVLAAAIARRMVVPPYRDGGQAQYIETPLPMADEEEPSGTTPAWMASHLDENLTVEQMAIQAMRSPRTFARRFRATLGTTPYQWLLQQRIMLAQRLLETTNESIERIAVRCGFSSAATLRLHFQRLLNTSPQTYRNAFHLEKVGEAASMNRHR